MGGRGAGIGRNNGQVVIHKQAEPNKQGYSYYMTGTRTVISHYDDEGNYSAKGFKEQEPIRQRFSSKEEAVKYAKKHRYSYMVM